MAATEALIGDAVVAELNAGSWGQSFTAVRRWLAVYDEADLEALKVTVVPLTLEQTNSSRATDQRRYGVAVDIQKRVNLSQTPAQVTAEIDALTEFAEEVHDFFSAGHRLATLPAWTVVDAQRPDLYSDELLYRHGRWETQIDLTVRGDRP